MVHTRPVNIEGHAVPSQKTDAVPELDLHALTVDEALTLIHGFLNDACLVGLKEVRIVHGKGTGILRQAVIRELKGHPLVKSYRTGSLYEGSTGATVVEL
jgi:DNA mismatch repair protein MutS2